MTSINNIINFFNNFKILILIIIIIKYIIFVIAMIFILNKEMKKSYYAFIPFLNLYYYAKSTKIPFIIFLIPLINIIPIVLSPYKLGNAYKCSKLLSICGIFIPDIFILYIALSDRTNKYIPELDMAIKSIEEIDKLEKDILTKSYNEDNNIPSKKESRLYELFPFLKTKKFEPINDIDTNIDNMIYGLENKIQNDEIIISDTQDIIENTDKTKAEDYQKNNDEIINTSIEKIIDNDTLSNTAIDNIEATNIEKELEDTKIDKNDYNDFKGRAPSDTAIAFGGESKEESKNKSKKDDLVCPRCGSSLIGAADYCLGCGLDIRNSNK